MIKKISTSGFTLIELLVAISIIAVITGLLLPNFMGAREKAADAKKKSDLVSMKNALRSYYNDNQEYPDTRAIWEAAIPVYAPQMKATGIGYTYFYRQTFGGEGFQLCVDLNSASATEISDSKNKCKDGANQVCNTDDAGVGVDSSRSTLYVVCGN